MNIIDTILDVAGLSSRPRRKSSRKASLTRQIKKVESALEVQKLKNQLKAKKKRLK